MAKQSSAQLFRCYIWLVDTIYTAGHISRADIDRKWAQNYTLNDMHESAIPERTFHNWRHAIEDLFQINIECDRKLGRTYYIEDADDLERGGVRNWLVNTFAINNLINESHHLKHQILFEKIPSGLTYLTPIIEAMRDHLAIRITYQRFVDTDSYERILEPYCVKVFKQRWYMVAKRVDKNELRVYALDRIQSFEVLDQSYKIPSTFDGEEYFRNCYGVSGMDKQPEHIEIRVDAYQANYLRTLPLHSSQQETDRQEQYSIFKFYLVPSFEFKQALRAHAPNLLVLEPASLREEMINETNWLKQRYMEE